MKMKVMFRTDASLEIGTGHVMRCLTLADALSERGARCIFICRSHQGHLLDHIVQRGHQALVLPVLEAEANLNGSAHVCWLGSDWSTDAQDTQRALCAHMGGGLVDWIVVDHYALDARWEESLRPKAKRIMVIDDLADRPHACDLLLDQNLGRMEEDYGALLKGNPTTLIGAQYALLRPDFAALRAHSLARRQSNQQLRCLLITMGGVDKENTTGQVLDALKTCALPADFRIKVVMGPQAPWLSEIKVKAAQMPCITEVLVGVNNMAQLMTDSDLAIGAAGGTAWERCSLGLPSIVQVLAQNQMAGSVALQNSGSAILLESFQQVAELVMEMQKKEIAHIVLGKLSRAAAAVTDGQGAARVADYMMGGVLA